MDNSKPAHTSKGVVGGVVAVLLAAGSLLGLYDLTEVFERAAEFALLGSGLWGVWSRYTADKKIAPIRIIPRRGLGLLALAAAVSLVVVACSGVPRYSEPAVQRAAEVAAAARSLAPVMAEPFADHQARGDAFIAQIETAATMSEVRGDDGAAELWRRMADPSRPLGVGMVHSWSEEGEFSPAVAREYSGVVASYADMIVELEASRPRGAGGALLSAIGKASGDLVGRGDGKGGSDD